MFLVSVSCFPVKTLPLVSVLPSLIVSPPDYSHLCLVSQPFLVYLSLCLTLCFCHFIMLACGPSYLRCSCFLLICQFWGDFELITGLPFKCEFKNYWTDSIHMFPWHACHTCRHHIHNPNLHVLSSKAMLELASKSPTYTHKDGSELQCELHLEQSWMQFLANGHFIMSTTASRATAAVFHGLCFILEAIFSSADFLTSHCHFDRISFLFPDEI